MGEKKQLNVACASNKSSILVYTFPGYLFSNYLLAFQLFRSLFCLNPAGDTPSSARLFDAIVSGCIPVIVSDELELPFEGILDYGKVCMHLYEGYDQITNIIKTLMVKLQSLF